jgi:uncharacterized secreted protein with C-terminal beta-propeller domain
MVFWNREQVPPELQDKKPEEIAASLKRLKELEEQQAASATDKSKFEEQLKALQTEGETMKAKLSEWENAAAQASAQMQQQQSAQQPSSVWDDPDKYIDERTRGTQIAAMGAARMAARLTFQQGLTPRDQKIFNKYGSEIDKTMETYHPMAQGMPQNWHTAFVYIKGLHEQDISKMEAENTPFFSEPGSRGAQQETKPAEEKLTPEEEEACETFHWDKAGYLKQKKAGAMYQSEKGAYARFPVPTRSESK